MAKVRFAPGVVSETTPLEVGAGWIDANLIRFRSGKAQPVGGWNQLGTVQMQGVCRSMKEFSNDAGSVRLALGTNQKAYILCSDTLYDITPAGFVAGLQDAQVATGYGIGEYGVGRYGTPRIPVSDQFSEIIQQPLLWSLDNFGEDLILNPRGGPLYIWHSVGGFGRPANLISSDPSAADVPVYAAGAFVGTQAQQVIALGCTPFRNNTPDPMQIRWSDIANPYLWTPLASNSAGGYRLPSGSYIIGWLPTYYETIIWTDTTVYTMQYLGNSFVYGFQPVATGISIISPNAGISAGSSVYWMDRGSFYVYSGSVTELPCSLKQEVFSSIDTLQAWKIHAAHNHAFSEIWWFYPSKNGFGDIDSYVIYNYKDGTWSKGQLQRTAWSDSGRLTTPVACDVNGYIYLHESGTDANGQPMPYYLTSGDIDIEDGEKFVLLQRLIPDFEFVGTLGKQQTLAVDYMVRDASSRTRRTTKTSIISSFGTNDGYIDARVRGRRVSFRFYNDNTVGTSWILGSCQAEFVANGRR